MGEHAAHGSKLTSQILDQTYPLSRYSPEDRLQALIFYLRARVGADEVTFRRTCTVDLGIPEPVITALLHGDIHAAHAALADLAQERDDHGWPLLASVLAYRGGLNADYGALAAALAEFEEIAMDPAARRLLPVSRTMLQRRGYQASAETFLADPMEAAVDPRLVHTHEELVEALECLRIRAGNPSLREIAARSATVPEGVDPTKHEHRSYNTLNKVLKVEESGPQMIPVLAFVRGCGVLEPEELVAWERVCARIRIAKRQDRLPPPRGSDQQEGWRAPSGPNPSLA
ncbi:hypothetical protein KIK06_29040 [Nocardiopsis sp. EMB25]|uniref:hypothetical protein n=1 Tax=Nocardiopsis sp. EMB25 TaxID=2835867 RepID=UPI00228441A6|nr:hypothetical protein [Nocardiopsis sp. EMB25]MCY9787930.1 hypothetical protein [Nocardiopsis sp. EMB25]